MRPLHRVVEIQILPLLKQVGSRTYSARGAEILKPLKREKVREYLNDHLREQESFVILLEPRPSIKGPTNQIPLKHNILWPSSLKAYYIDPKNRLR